MVLPFRSEQFLRSFFPMKPVPNFSYSPSPTAKTGEKIYINAFVIAASQTPASQLWFTLEVFLLGLLSGNPRDGAEIDGTLETHVWLLWSRLLNRHVGK